VAFAVYLTEAAESLVLNIQPEQVDIPHARALLLVVNLTCVLFRQVPERRRKLFKRYMTGASGSGLGLSVVHAITHMFGGDIKVSSRVESDYSKGTMFTLTFPIYEEDI